jgi:hypothetical protein
MFCVLKHAWPPFYDSEEFLWHENHQFLGRTNSQFKAQYQGDQNGRIFAQWVIVKNWQFLRKLQKQSTFLRYFFRC